MGTDNLHRKRRTAKDLRPKKPTREPNPTFLIVCEGTKTEKNYFEAFRDHVKLNNLHIKPSPKSDIKHINKFAKEQQKKQGFTTIFCVVDADTRDVNDVQREIKPPLQAIVSKPCFEYWILLHYEYTNKCFGGGAGSSCNELINNALKNICQNIVKNIIFLIRFQIKG